MTYKRTHFIWSLWQLFYSKEITICQVPNLMFLSKIRRTCFPTPNLLMHTKKSKETGQQLVSDVLCWWKAQALKCYQQHLPAETGKQLLTSIALEIPVGMRSLEQLSLPFEVVWFLLFFFNCKMTWHCCVLFRVFPSVIFGTSALGCADHWSCTIYYLKPQEKSIVEIMNVVIWRRRVEEKILMMLKGVIVRLRKQRHTLPAVFSPSWKQQIVSKQHRNTFLKCIPRQICEGT